MSIKQTMSTPVAQDSAGVAAVVNEATDGTKSVLTELATKNADDSGFTQVSEANPLPVTGAVQLTGSIVAENPFDLRGLAVNKPVANSVEAGTTYWSVDTDPHGDAVEVSDGTNWTVV